MNIFLFFSLLFILCPQVLAEPDDFNSSQEKLMEKNKGIGLTLSDAISLGLRNNLAINSAYLDRVAEKFDLSAAEDRLTPKLQLNGRWIAGKNENNSYKDQVITPSATLLSPVGTKFSLSWVKYDSLTRNKENYYHNDGVTLSVIQPLLKGAGYDVTTAPIEIAKINEQINRLNLKITISDTITSIIVAYRDLVQAQEKLLLTNEYLKRSIQIFEINKQLLTTGKIAEIDIVQTQADVAMQELAVRNAKTDLYNKRLNLLNFINLSFKENIYASDRPDAKFLKIDPVIAFNKAIEMQPNYLVKILSINLSEENLKVAENNQLWDLSLIGSLSRQKNKKSSVDSEYKNYDKYIGVQIYIPFNDVSLKQDAIRSSVILRQRKMIAEDAKKELEKSIYGSIMDAESRWEEFVLISKARDLSIRKVNAERKKLLAGHSSNFQVLSYENDLRNTENSRLTALIDYLNTLSQIDNILGTTLYSWGVTVND